mmetsp:Transcript_10312/g.24776  ORF Transcript_10312/g.24776 Transcript_10312/m.24776 type:complete len:213 (-) Transcript_10312:908-1546(-)
MNQVHRQGILRQGQKAILVHVCEGPDAVQHVRGQVALYHLLLGLLGIDLPVHGMQSIEVSLELLNCGRSLPLALVHRLLGIALHFHHSERRGHANNLGHSCFLNAVPNLLLRNQLQQLWQVHGEQGLHCLQLLRINWLERAEIHRGEDLLHHSRIWEVAQGNTLLHRDLLIDAWQLLYHPFLLFCVSKKCRHPLVEIVQQQCVNFCQPSSFY